MGAQVVRGDLGGLSDERLVREHRHALVGLMEGSAEGEGDVEPPEAIDDRDEGGHVLGADVVGEADEERDHDDRRDDAHRRDPVPRALVPAVGHEHAHHAVAVALLVVEDALVARVLVLGALHHLHQHRAEQRVRLARRGVDGEQLRRALREARAVRREGVERVAELLVAVVRQYMSSTPL